MRHRDRVRSAYKRFRKAGEQAQWALRSAKTATKFDYASDFVRVVAMPDNHADTSFWTPEDFASAEQDGCWGVVGQFRTERDDEWTDADSVWGFVGYEDVLDPAQNPYITDIMGATLDALRFALKSRCPLCHGKGVRP